MKRKSRRRGRKNKYYAQIDVEDELEIKQVEADVVERLQVIQEQVEAEAILRKEVTLQTQT